MDPYSLLQAPTGIPQGATTPTPMEIQNMYDYAKALQGSKLPVSTWPAGVSNMLNSLMGGLYAGKANAASRMAAQASGGAAYSPVGNTSGNAVYDDAPSAKPASSEGALNFATSGGSDDTMQRMERATSKQESGGNYQSIGPETKYGRALGKYQIMPENVEKWSKEFLGKSLTPQEFLNDAAAQDAIYRGKMGQYVQKYGVEGAGRAWLGGEGGVNHPERRDVLGTSIGDYGRKQAALVGGGGGTSAMAFNGEPPSSAPIVRALTQVAQADRPPAAQTGPPGGGKWDPQPTVPAGMVPTRPLYTPEQLRLQLYYATTPAEKVGLVKNYMEQFQPIQVPVTGGTVWVDRTNPNHQKFVPTLEKGKSKIGPIEEEAPYTVSPFGGSGQQTGINPAVPNVPPAATPPPVRPSAPPVPPANIRTVPVRPGTPGGPMGVVGPQGALPAPATVGAATPPPTDAQAPVRLALANTGTISDAPPPGAASVAPPPSPGAASLLSPPTAAPAGPQVAQMGPPTGQFTLPNAEPPPPPPSALPSTAPPGINPATWAKFRGVKEYEQGLDISKTNQVNQMEASNKQWQTMRQQALAAGEFLPQLRLAQNLAADKNNPQGIFANAKMFYHRVLSGLGQDTNNEAAVGQVFTKVLSASVLDSLRSFTQGASVGQIRTMEITLARLSNAGLENTPEANQVLLNLAVKSHERLIEIAKQASTYVKQHGYLDSDWDEHIFNWQKQNPIMSPNEEKDFRRLFDKGEGQVKPGILPGKFPTSAPPSPLPPGNYTYDPKTKKMVPTPGQ